MGWTACSRLRLPGPTAANRWGGLSCLRFCSEPCDSFDMADLQHSPGAKTMRARCLKHHSKPPQCVWNSKRLRTKNPGINLVKQRTTFKHKFRRIWSSCTYWEATSPSLATSEEVKNWIFNSKHFSGPRRVGVLPCGCLGAYVAYPVEAPCFTVLTYSALKAPVIMQWISSFHFYSTWNSINTTQQSSSFVCF